MQLYYTRPQVALRIIVPKIRNENEKVAMLSLAVSIATGIVYSGIVYLVVSGIVFAVSLLSTMTSVLASD